MNKKVEMDSFDWDMLKYVLTAKTEHLEEVIKTIDLDDSIIKLKEMFEATLSIYLEVISIMNTYELYKECDN